MGGGDIDRTRPIGFWNSVIISNITLLLYNSPALLYGFLISDKNRLDAFDVTVVSYSGVFRCDCNNFQSTLLESKMSNFQKKGSSGEVYPDVRKNSCPYKKSHAKPKGEKNKLCYRIFSKPTILRSKNDDPSLAFGGNYMLETCSCFISIVDDSLKSLSLDLQSKLIDKIHICL